MNLAPLDLDLIRKYNQPGPRYTSYPTALQFREDLDRTALLEEVRAETGPLSLYAHIPFCESLCWFCGCTTTITRNHGFSDRYLDALEREMDLLAPWVRPGRPVVQVHLGGGTPNFLLPPQIERLGAMLRRRYTFAADAECGVELDPRTLHREQVAAFAAAGFNRASFGVQDCNLEVQQAVHRVQPRALNEAALEWLRAAGFTSINIDLIYGLPRQTVESFRETLAEVLDYRPDRLAVFSYAHVPWIKPAQKILEQREVLPGPELKLQILMMVIETLTRAGYVYIGMDHFARADDELAVAARERTLHRNFQGYTTRAGAELQAFGMSAISQTRSTFRQNQKRLDTYQGPLQRGELPIEKGYRLTPEDHLRREVITRLMCDFQLDLTALSQRLGVDLESHLAAELAGLEDLQADGLVRREGACLFVTGIGRLLIRNIAMRFDQYLQQGPRRHSRTI